MVNLIENQHTYLALHFVPQHLPAAALFCLIFLQLKPNVHFRSRHPSDILTKVLLD